MGFFAGKPQVGSASKFKGKGALKQPFAPNVSNAQLDKPPAPQAYQGLRSGPDFTIEYEPNQTPAIDGSASLLRTLSPFMIQVEPPLAYAGFSDKSKKDYAGILGAGHGSAPSAFQAARLAFGDPEVDGSVTAGATSVEQFVAQGVLNKPQGSGAEGATDLKGQGATRIGTPAIADLYTAVDITMQLKALINTPPLVLLINPQSLAMTYTKLQQFSDRTRFGFIFQAWGEEQPRLSVEAKCGAFISGGRGVQWASRRDSASWQNLATAFQFYRHNGYIYDTVGKSNAHHFVGALSIHYDGWVYYGNMESFNYTFDESVQHGGITFSMEFTVNAMVDTSKSSPVVLPMKSPVPSASDPRYSGMNRQASPSHGDLTIGGSNGVQLGGSNFYTVNGVERGDGATTPKPSVGTQVGPGIMVAPPSTQGFVAPSAVQVASRIPPQAGKTRPFGLGR